MLENRAFRIALVVIFVILLFYNVLYFTGFLGGADTGTVQQVQQSPMLDMPGVSTDQGGGGRQPAARPVPSRERAGDRRQTAVEPPRAAVPVADLTVRGEWGRNPFLTPEEIEALAMPVEMRVAQRPDADVDLNVTAIVTESTGRRVAVVNNEVVTVGGIVGGMEVAEILDRAVVFRSGGRERVVTLSEAPIRLRVRRNPSTGASYE